MIEKAHQYIITHSNITQLSTYSLLKHVHSALFLDHKDYLKLVPSEITINEAIFTHPEDTLGFPPVHIQQQDQHIMLYCSCAQPKNKLCDHQAQALFCLLEKENYRIFFDDDLRRRKLRAVAKDYGLEQEKDLDAFFSIHYEDGKINIQTQVKELLKIDQQHFERHLLPITSGKPNESKPTKESLQTILVIGRHRYYQQLHIQLMQAERTLQGALKNPVDPIDSMSLLWKTQNSEAIKFYTALYALQNQYKDAEESLDANILLAIAKNPLDFPVYYHDRAASEKVNSRTLRPVSLQAVEATMELFVFKKEPFYEITGELHLAGLILPFSALVIRYQSLIYHQEQFYALNNPDVLRALLFFKANHEKLLIHPSKYAEFMEQVLAPLEEDVRIHYRYMKAAAAAQQEAISKTMEPLLYLEQEGSYIALTPVMKYGNLEVPVYSKKQLYTTDENKNSVHIARNLDAEERLTRVIMQQHSDFKAQRMERRYFYLHKDLFFDEDWFLQAFEQWRNQGISILGFNKLSNTNTNAHQAKIDIQILSGEDWFNMALTIQFGSQTASLKDIQRSIRRKQKFVELGDGTQGLLPEAWLQKIASYFQRFEVEKDLFKIPKVAFEDMTALLDETLLGPQLQQEVQALRSALTHSKKAPNVPLPQALQATLRPYQQEGLNWLVHLDKHHFGGCLADDMGLGKTLQIIAFIVYLAAHKKPAAPHLIVVPTSLLSNWEAELAKFAPTIRFQTYHGATKNKDVLHAEDYDVLLTSYGTIQADLTTWRKLSFDCIFLDEAQAIKNPSAQRYKAMCTLKARNRFTLTGTPIENNSFDIYAQLSFCCPGLLGNKPYFKNTYALPIDRFGDRKRAQELYATIAPFLLRRTKNQVAKELPEKTEVILYCEMGEKQRAVYDRYEEELRNFVATLDEDAINEKRPHVLAGLTRLRQLCDSPLLLKEGYSGEDATKVKVLMEEINAKVGEHKILVFSQFVEMLDIIKEALEQQGIGYAYLTGQTTNRGQKVESFKNEADVRVFLISLKAGGVGLNLTEADYVYLVDPWWNPAVENQAIDRIHRIGQTKKVIAVRLICSQSVEEKMLNLQQRKKQLAQDLVKAQWLNNGGSLSKQELVDLLKPSASDA